jgi:hypothetical protein
MTEKKNIFVLGTDDFNLIKLRSLRHAQEFAIHKLLDYEEIRGSAEYDIVDLLARVEKRLHDFEGSVDGIIGYFDFPVTNMRPILCEQYGLPCASLSSVMKCEHKYWSRLEQRRAVPDNIPAFDLFDPFDPQALDKLGVRYPFWIKPVKSFRSYLGFRINHQHDWEQAIPIIRENIGNIAEPFNYLMNYLEDAPAEVLHTGGGFCLAEGIIYGKQCTLEGYVHRGEVISYGVVDSVRENNNSSFSRYEYPSTLPKRVQERMAEISERIISHIGYDHSTFNIEYFYHEPDDQIWLLEINPRMSQSHGDLFQKVDGDSNHSIMIDLSIGRKPDFPYREGTFGHAAKFMLRHFEDGIVTRVPSEEDIAAAAHSFPGTLVEVFVEEGTRLSELLNQDSYSFEIADIYIGASTQKDLLETYHQVLQMLDFRIEPIMAREEA